jgi:hypothetical protein
MKKYISILLLLVVTATAYAIFSNEFKNWNDSIERSPDIVIAKCASTVGTTNSDRPIIISDGVIPSDIEVISVLKGNTKPGPSHLFSWYWPHQSQQFLLFASHFSDEYNTGYSAIEYYRVVPLSHDFQTNMLAGKTLEEQIHWILERRLFDLNEELKRGTEEKKRLEEGLKTIGTGATSRSQTNSTSPPNLTH